MKIILSNMCGFNPADDYPDYCNRYGIPERTDINFIEYLEKNDSFNIYRIEDISKGTRYFIDEDSDGYEEIVTDEFIHWLTAE